MKTKLEKLKTEKDKLDADIRKLEEDIAKTDSNAANIAKLVSVDTVQKKDFSHYIELQGKIDADNIAYVAPRGAGRSSKSVYVKLGRVLSKASYLKTG